MVLLVMFIVSSMSPTLIKEYNTFIMMRIINAAATSVIFQIPYIMVLEMVGPQRRTFISVLVGVGWALGLCAIAPVAYLSRSWVGLNATSITVAVILVFLTK